MEGLGMIYFIIVSAIFLIPFIFAIVYLILGIKSFLNGKKEKSKPKLIGAYNTIFIATIVIIGDVFIWYLACGFML